MVDDAPHLYRPLALSAVQARYIPAYGQRSMAAAAADLEGSLFCAKRLRSEWYGTPREGTTEMRSFLRAAVMMGRGEDDMS